MAKEWVNDKKMSGALCFIITFTIWDKNVIRKTIC